MRIIGLKFAFLSALLSALLVSAMVQVAGEPAIGLPTGWGFISAWSQRR